MTTPLQVCLEEIWPERSTWGRAENKMHLGKIEWATKRRDTTDPHLVYFWKKGEEDKFKSIQIFTCSRLNLQNSRIQEQTRKAGSGCSSPGWWCRTRRGLLWPRGSSCASQNGTCQAEDQGRGEVLPLHVFGKLSERQLLKRKQYFLKTLALEHLFCK